jgi:hypothetical protein
MRGLTVLDLFDDLVPHPAYGESDAPSQRTPNVTHPLLGTARLEGAPQLLAPGRVLGVFVQTLPVKVAGSPASLPFLHGRGCHSCWGSQ